MDRAATTGAQRGEVPQIHDAATAQAVRQVEHVLQHLFLVPRWRPGLKTGPERAEVNGSFSWENGWFSWDGGCHDIQSSIILCKMEVSSWENRL